MKITPKTLEETLAANGCHPSSVGRMLKPEKKGYHTTEPVFVVKKTFFYTHGFSSDKWADKVVAALQAAGLNVKCLGYDEAWNTWPKDSFWAAYIQIQN